MKKFYLLAAAATIMTACTNNEKMTADLDNDGPVLIGFETYHEKSTKATGAIDNGTDLTFDHGGFGVWGFKGASAEYSSTAKKLANRGFTTVFDNVKVWYEGGSTPTQGYKYTVPKYWDKGMKYIFFAYAPFDGTNATIDWDTKNDSKEGTGIIKISDIPSIQNVSKSKDNKAEGDADNKPENIQFEGSNTTGVTDYLMATCVQNQYLTAANTTITPSGTNQNYVDNDNEKAAYTKQEQTVGFTFGHMLSKFQVKLQAKEKYSGVQSIDVSYLAIVNMPEVETDKAEFTQTSPTAAAGTYSPDNWDGKTLQIINTDATVVGDKAKNANATSKNTLYILKNGAGKDDQDQETTNADDIASIVDPQPQPQIFNYYVAPSKADKSTTTDASETYKLNIKYTITYIDGTTEVVTPATIDLSTSTTPLTEFLQNNSYILTINVGLNQIYFTVDAVKGWTDVDEKTIEIQ